MSERKTHLANPAPQPRGDVGRRHRQAEALRRNLLRRKDQARARRADLPAEPESDAEQG